jgi:hypothetical protein
VLGVKRALKAVDPDSAEHGEVPPIGGWSVGVFILSLKIFLNAISRKNT